MKPKALGNITKALKVVLRELAKSGLKDKNTRCQYAEYFVAKKLADKKHEVQILDERENLNADIYLPKLGVRVEVKSSCFYDGGWAYASFSDGSQIKKGKFDYCVWLIFNQKNCQKPKKTFVFSKAELHEVGKARRGYGSHETNSCLLTYGKTLKEYDDYMKTRKYRRLQIERAILKNEDKYREAWNKIRKAK
jgi:hypothetical protein